MERKIGEIFEYDGEWYQCLPEILICNGCTFKNKTCKEIKGIRGECQRASRQTDGVIFKKLEKLREPYHFGKKLMQPYKLFTKPVIPLGLDCFTIRAADDSSIDIEIKQNKEEMEEKKLNNYIVYKHISPNGKEYVGMTRNLKKRWEGNGCSYKKNSEFRNDIMKYGWDNFQHIIIKDGLSVDEASKLEDELIVNAMNRGVAYNISRGGIGGAHPAWNKGIPLSKEQIEKLRAANLGKIMSEETRRKIGDASRGHIVSDETKRKIGDKNRGKKHSKEHTSKWIKSNMWRFHRVEIRKDGIYVGTYESIKEAARSIGKSRGFIDGIIRRPKGKHQGYTVIILD